MLIAEDQTGCFCCYCDASIAGYVLLLLLVDDVEQTKCAEWSILFLCANDSMSVVVVSMQAFLCLGDGSAVLL